MYNKNYLEKRVDKLEQMLNKKYKKVNENIMVSTFDCAKLSVQIEKLLSDIDGYVSVTDDNADYGFINVGIEIGKLQVSYDIIVEDVDHMELIFNDENDKEKRVCYCASLNDCAEEIANHIKNYNKNYIDKLD